MNWRRIRSVLPGAAAVGVVVLVMQFEFGQLPKPGFYEMAAQVIPVLIVALAIEGQAHRLWTNLRTVYKLQVFLCLALGQIAAIVAAAGAFAATPASLARQVVDEWGPSRREVEAAIRQDPGEFAEGVGLPVRVVRRAIDQQTDEGEVLVEVLEEMLHRQPDAVSRFVGPDLFWSNLLAGITVSGLVFGVLAVLVCAFLPQERVRGLLKHPLEESVRTEHDAAGSSSVR